MSGVLLDTSAWVEFLRATGSPTHRRARAALAVGDAVTTDVVVLELLCGASTAERAQDLRRALDACHFLPQEPRADVEAAGALFRACRARGLTVRGANDCLVAAVALRADVPVLHRDRDFSAIAQVTDLRDAGEDLAAPPG